MRRGLRALDTPLDMRPLRGLDLSWCERVTAVPALLLALVATTLLAEVGVPGGVGTLKVLLWRGASSIGDPRFFEAGLLERLRCWVRAAQRRGGRLSAEARAPAVASAPAGAEQRCAAAPARDGPTRG